jgi:hypothetical protein
MTPTLLGRWQTRLLLLGTAGLVVTLIFGRIFGDATTPLALLGYVLAIGFGWDVLYQYLQSFRWDRDWPPAFQLAAGIFEGLALWGIAQYSFRIWGGLPGVAASLTAAQFVAHYATVWLVVFLGTQGPLRVIFPRWRYRGGEWL